jgi:ribosomal-protein-alanine N-acetyltransferase
MQTDSPTGLTFRALTRVDAEAVLSWRYPAPYEIYNLDARASDGEVDSILRPEHQYFAVLDAAKGLIAFRCFGIDARVAGGDYTGEALDMGGGLRPDLIGRGLGRHVISAAMSFAIERYNPARFRVTIALFNGRARRVCESLGYSYESAFVRAADQLRFVVLSRQATASQGSNDIIR